MKTLNIAHRGASGDYPENTMLAFFSAKDLGCHGIETDVQLTKDNIPVLIHDETVNRTTNGKGFVKDYTYSELVKLDAGSHFSNKFSCETIPTLDELMNFAKNSNLILNLELKNSIINYPNLEEIVLNKINEYSLGNKIIISSFNHYSMKHFKNIAPHINVGLLYDINLYHPEKYAKFVGADALHPNFHSLNSKIVKDSHNENIKINTYTVNTLKDMESMLKLKVDGIITNYPGILKKIIDK
ncbi:glycerophosphodiester phosphodiesterase [Clostridium akagii]|uniref:glycerophosphodiester phosphodiesterase n=1 Tax=Clostridium akagii TaxID=91623 RepID=UPI00055EC662|nr:glycerophosphodiester phosphodiesterase [Clostridium akagii]